MTVFNTVNARAGLLANDKRPGPRRGVRAGRTRRGRRSFSSDARRGPCRRYARTTGRVCACAAAPRRAANCVNTRRAASSLGSVRALARGPSPYPAPPIPCPPLRTPRSTRKPLGPRSILSTVYMYMYVYAWTYIFIYTRARTHTRTHSHIHMHVRGVRLTTTAREHSEKRFHPRPPSSVI